MWPTKWINFIRLSPFENFQLRNNWSISECMENIARNEVRNVEKVRIVTIQLRTHDLQKTVRFHDKQSRTLLTHTAFSRVIPTNRQNCDRPSRELHKLITYSARVCTAAQSTGDRSGGGIARKCTVDCTKICPDSKPKICVSGYSELL